MLRWAAERLAGDTSGRLSGRVAWTATKNQISLNGKSDLWRTRSGARSMFDGTGV